ncbi:hypothetical protein M9458_031410, partial [Cirrhinus mrigala]
MYTVPERERLTPSPADSPRTQQIVPSARYTMQPFLQDQFVNNLTQSRLYNTERTVPQTNSMLSPQVEDAGAAQRWLVTSVQQTSGNKLELTAYEGDYSSSLLPYSFKSLPLQSAHSLGYYPDAAFASVTAGWGSRGSFPRKVASGLPWSPRPSPTDFTDDQMPDKDKSREGNTFSQTSAWMDGTPSLKPLDSVEPSIYSVVCKRRRVSLSEAGVENSPTVKCEDSSTSENFNKDNLSNSKTVGYYAFYASS